MCVTVCLVTTSSNSFSLSVVLEFLLFVSPFVLFVLILFAQLFSGLVPLNRLVIMLNRPLLVVPARHGNSFFYMEIVCIQLFSC